MSKEQARPGDALASCGYGSNGRFWCNRGRALRYVVAGGTPAAETLELSGAARQGDSGGPIFNDRHELVGLVLGTNGRIVTGTASGRIRAFLAGLSPRFRRQMQDPALQPAVPDKVTPETPDAQPPQSPGADPQLSDYVAELRRRIETVDQRIATHADKLDQRLGRVTNIAGRLEQRIAKAETILAEGNLREWVSQAVASSRLGDRIDPLAWLWPIVAGALGLSAPPTLIVVAWKLARCHLRRRRRGRLRNIRSRRRSAHDEQSPRRPHLKRQLNDDYAEQLNRLFAHSGRSPAQDATLGREYDEQLTVAAESSDPKLADWARKLRNRVQTKFHRIHGFAPSPTEPVKA